MVDSVKSAPTHQRHDCPSKHWEGVDAMMQKNRNMSLYVRRSTELGHLELGSVTHVACRDRCITEQATQPRELANTPELGNCGAICLASNKELRKVGAVRRILP